VVNEKQSEGAAGIMQDGLGELSTIGNGKG